MVLLKIRIKYMRAANQTKAFFRHHPVFTFREFFREIGGLKKERQQTIRNMLVHHLKMGHIVRAKRELYASIPYGADPITYPVNPFLIAGYAAPDAVIGYNSALAFYQMTYSMVYRIIFLSASNSRSFNFGGEYYQCTRYPRSLTENKKEQVYVKSHDVQGMMVKVTNLERTIVDILDRPELGGGWEEIYRSLEMVNHVNIEDMVSYALLLGNATTIAKLGFYLSQRQHAWGVGSEHLNELMKHRPLSVHYVDRFARKDGHFLSKWNIIVPKELVDQSWNEPMDDDVA